MRTKLLVEVYRFLLSLVVSEINSTKLTNKCWIPKSELSSFNVVFLQNDHLYGLLMDQQKCSYFISKRGLKWEKNSEILHIWKSYLIPEIVQNTMCLVYYCVQHITVSNKILCPHFLICTLVQLSLVHMLHSPYIFM